MRLIFGCKWSLRCSRCLHRSLVTDKVQVVGAPPPPPPVSSFGTSRWGPCDKRQSCRSCMENWEVPSKPTLAFTGLQVLQPRQGWKRQAVPGCCVLPLIRYESVRSCLIPHTWKDGWEVATGPLTGGPTWNPIWLRISMSLERKKEKKIFQVFFFF